MLAWTGTGRQEVTAHLFPALLSVMSHRQLEIGFVGIFMSRKSASATIQVWLLSPLPPPDQGSVANHLVVYHCVEMYNFLRSCQFFQVANILSCDM